MNKTEQSLDTPLAYDNPRAEEQDIRRLPEHMARLPGTQWALWRSVGLRGAGFPAAHVLKLAAPRSAALADRLLEAEAASQRIRDELLDALRRDLDHADPETRIALVQAIRRVKTGKLPEVGAATAGREALLDLMQAAAARVEAACAEFRQTLAEEVARLSQEVYAVARMERFREAVIWQNRRAYHTGIQALLRKAPGSTPRSSKQRQHEELIAGYLQRYCVKNDTIGFFGPVGWATLVPEEAAVTTLPGPTFLANRTVYFETWCIEALAQALTRDHSLQPWIAPRRTPVAYLNGTSLYLPSRGAVNLSAAQAAVLRACDGTRTTRQIVAELLKHPASGLRGEAEVYQLLEYFSSRSLIQWSFRIPLKPHPNKVLRQLLEQMDDDQVRRPALAALDELEGARAEVMQAAGDADKLDRALSSLEDTFTRLTNMASTRNEGKTYAGRTLIYEDCRRDIQVHLGAALIESLSTPLGLILTSARWLSFEIAQAFRQVFTDMYAELVRKTGSRTVDLAMLWTKAQPVLSAGNANPLISACRARLQERWAEILDLPAGQRRVQYSSAELLPRVLHAFAAPRPGWKAARYHSPDIMIAASSTEDIRQGAYQFVMGELHLGANTLGAAFFVEEYPSHEAIFRAVEHDLPDPRIIAIPPRHWHGITTRTQFGLGLPKDFYLDAAPNTSYDGPPSRTLPLGALVLEDAGSGLVVRTRDGQQSFDLIEVFADILTFISINSFKILQGDDHTPRIAFDQLVVCRESWHPIASEIEFAYLKDEAERFIAARRWAQRYGMPRFVFIKAAVEPKPSYVDFDSPIYVDIFAKTIRRTVEAGMGSSSISVTEMLPGTDQTWLPDADGQRYTSELRLVAVDMINDQDQPAEENVAAR